MATARDRESCIGCHHPAWGKKGEGHFGNGAGPCKHMGCLCPAFVPDPELRLRRREEEWGMVARQR